MILVCFPSSICIAPNTAIFPCRYVAFAVGGGELVWHENGRESIAAHCCLCISFLAYMTQQRGVVGFCCWACLLMTSDTYGASLARGFPRWEMSGIVTLLCLFF